MIFFKIPSSFFYELCRKQWPRFSEIEKLAEQNKLVSNPKQPGHSLNFEEYLAAPLIGLFQIETQGERKRPDGEDPPYGAMIVRTNSDVLHRKE